ncbi:MAG TPA: ELWxxDGT repeat protein [Chitinophagaceae bacterium]
MRKFYWVVVITVALSFDANGQTFSLVKDINPGTTAGNPGNLVAINESVFFRANDAVHGNELWKSNGTETGTVLIKDINPGPASGNPAELININGTIYFHANDGVHGDELWKSNGTEAGTMMVKDINPGLGNSAPSRFLKINNTLFFCATNGTHGIELWKTDGTEAGTVLVKDLYPGATGSNPQYMVNMGGVLFFSAADGIHAGYDLWKTDGTETGTVMIKDVYPGSGSAVVANLVTMNGKLFFTAGGDPASTLWKSDGTGAGTEIVKGFIFPLGLTNVNGTLYFQGRTQAEGTELWKTNGTESGTVLVKDIKPGTGSGNPQKLIAVDTNLFFMADDGSGYKLWKTNGSVSGTKKVKDILPENMTNVNGKLYFSAWEGTAGALNDKEVWRSDGTEQGTVIVQNIAQTGGSSPADFTLANLNLFITAAESTAGRELWMADLSVPIGGLPLTMVDFKGQLSGNNVILGWKTLAEHNTSHFEIERSTDGSFFTKLSNLAAAGNSTNTKQYTYTDPNIALPGISSLYYRLKMKDLDGKFTYSKIIAVNISSKELVVMLYPNPASENITLMIAALKKETIAYSIIDINGRTVQQKKISINEGSNLLTIETSAMAAGIYTIVLNGTITNSRMKFVKQ